MSVDPRVRWTCAKAASRAATLPFTVSVLSHVGVDKPDSRCGSFSTAAHLNCEGKVITKGESLGNGSA